MEKKKSPKKKAKKHKLSGGTQNRRGNDSNHEETNVANCKHNTSYFKQL